MSGCFCAISNCVERREPTQINSEPIQHLKKNKTQDLQTQRGPQEATSLFAALLNSLFKGDIHIFTTLKQYSHVH